MAADFRGALDDFFGAFPGTRVYEAQLRALDAVIDSHPLVPFFESVSVTITDEKRNATLLSVGAPELTSWTLTWRRRCGRVFALWKAPSLVHSLQEILLPA